MRMTIFVLIALCALLLLISYAILAMAHDADERAERMYRKWKEEHDGLDE